MVTYYEQMQDLYSVFKLIMTIKNALEYILT